MCAKRFIPRFKVQKRGSEAIITNQEDIANEFRNFYEKNCMRIEMKKEWSGIYHRIPKSRSHIFITKR